MWRQSGDKIGFVSIDISISNGFESNDPDYCPPPNTFLQNDIL